MIYSEHRLRKMYPELPVPVVEFAWNTVRNLQWAEHVGAIGVDSRDGITLNVHFTMDGREYTCSIRENTA